MTLQQRLRTAYVVSDFVTPDLRLHVIEPVLEVATVGQEVLKIVGVGQSALPGLGLGHKVS